VDSGSLRLMLKEVDRRKHFAMMKCSEQRSRGDDRRLLYEPAIPIKQKVTVQ